MDGSDRAEEVLKGNPRCVFIRYAGTVRDGLPIKKHQDRIDELTKQYGIDRAHNLSGSLEHRVAVHMGDPAYVWSKPERLAKHGINFSEAAFRHCGFSHDPEENMRPEIFLGPEETEWVERFWSSYNLDGKRVILVVFNGSSLVKTYPYLSEILSDWISRKGKRYVLVSVGDNEGRLGEWDSARLIQMATKCTFRQSVAILARAALFIGPDTGMLHASGCFDVPKVGIVGHHSREQITKYFTNDFSIYAGEEGNTECAPCTRLVPDPMAQCPMVEIGEDEAPYPWCMGRGIRKERVVQKIEEALACSN